MATRPVSGGLGRHSVMIHSNRTGLPPPKDCCYYANAPRQRILAFSSSLYIVSDSSRFPFPLLSLIHLPSSGILTSIFDLIGIQLQTSTT